MRRRRVLALVAAAISACAAADVEPPRASARGPDGGVWAQATLVQPTGSGSLALQYGEPNANRIRYLAVQGERRLDRHRGVGAACALGDLGSPGRPNPALHLFHLLANWTNAGNAIEVDARPWGEVLVADPGVISEPLRTRGRNSVGLPAGLPLDPRLFVPDELFFVRGDGLARNGVSTGLRSHPMPRLSRDLAWQRTDDVDGANQHVFLIQGTLVLGKRS